MSTGGPGTNAPVHTKGWLCVMTGGSGLLALEVRKALRLHGKKILNGCNEHSWWEKK